MHDAGMNPSRIPALSERLLSQPEVTRPHSVIEEKAKAEAAARKAVAKVRENEAVFAEVWRLAEAEEDAAAAARAAAATRNKEQFRSAADNARKAKAARRAAVTRATTAPAAPTAAQAARNPVQQPAPASRTPSSSPPVGCAAKPSRGPLHPTSSFTAPIAPTIRISPESSPTRAAPPPTRAPPPTTAVPPPKAAPGSGRQTARTASSAPNPSSRRGVGERRVLGSLLVDQRCASRLRAPGSRAAEDAASKPAHEPAPMSATASPPEVTPPSLDAEVDPFDAIPPKKQPSLPPTLQAEVDEFRESLSRPASPRPLSPRPPSPRFSPSAARPSALPSPAGKPARMPARGTPPNQGVAALGSVPTLGGRVALVRKPSFTPPPLSPAREGTVWNVATGGTPPVRATPPAIRARPSAIRGTPPASHDQSDAEPRSSFFSPHAPTPSAAPPSATSAAAMAAARRGTTATTRGPMTSAPQDRRPLAGATPSPSHTGAKLKEAGDVTPRVRKLQPAPRRSLEASPYSLSARQSTTLLPPVASGRGVASMGAPPPRPVRPALVRKNSQVGPGTDRPPQARIPMSQHDPPLKSPGTHRWSS